MHVKSASFCTDNGQTSRFSFSYRISDNKNSKFLFFSIQKLIFFIFFSLYKCRKILTIKTTLRSVHTRRQVAAKNRFVCTGEFCENLCCCNRILSPQQVTQIQSDLIFCDLLQRQILLQKQRFSQTFSRTHEAICRCVALACCCN